MCRWTGQRWHGLGGPSNKGNPVEHPGVRKSEALSSRRRLSVAWVLAAALVIVAVVPSGVFAVSLFGEQRAQIKRDAVDRLTALGNVQAARARAYLARAQEASSLVVSRHQLQERAAALLEPAGPVQVGIAESLRHAVDNVPIIEAAAVLTSDGLVIAADDPSRVGSIEHIDASDTGVQQLIGDVVMGRDDRPVLRVYSMLHIDGEAATLVIDASTAPLWDLTGDFTGMGQTGETIIAELDPSGAALFVTPLRFDPGAALQRRVARETKLPINHALAGLELTMTDAVDYRGEPVFAVSRSLPGDLGLVVKIDRSEALAPITSLVKNLLGSVLLALTGAAVLTYVLTRRLTSPLRSLRNAAVAVAGGHSNRRAPVRGPRELAELAHSVNRMTAELVTTNRHLEESNGELEQANSALLNRAMHDPLTGLPNRALMLDRLEHELARAAREGTWLGVLFCDLDRFKIVNDSLGHIAGDRLLVEIAGRLAGAIRGVDTVARIGGDEFVVIAGGLARPEEVIPVAEHIRAVVEPTVELDGDQAHVSVSIGIVTISPSEARTENPLAVLRDADTAMFVAKERGRARWELYSENLSGKAEKRRLLEVDLRKAVAADQFEVVYQPIVDLRTKRPKGVEALVRWRHPTNGLLLPGRFLETAEESGVIVDIGAQVLREACKTMASWNRRRERPLWVAVNVSGRQLGRAEFPDMVRSALASSGLEPGQLRLEVTENALVGTSHSAIREVSALHELGVGLGLDDFGTGTSSLTFVQTLPIDFIKIDKSFVRAIRSDQPTSTAVASALFALTDALGIEAIAEGIENEQQAAELRRLGGATGQGFLYARPALSADVEPILDLTPRVKPVVRLP